VAFSPDGKRLVAMFNPPPPKGAGKPNDPREFIVRVFDVDTGKQITPDLPFTTDDSPTLSFAAGGRLVVAPVVSGWSSGKVTQTIWDVQTGKLLALAEPVRTLHGRADDPFLLSTSGAGRSQRAHVRDARSLAVVGKPLQVYEVRHAAVSGDGKRVFIANSYWLGTWDVTTGERLHARFAVYGGAKCVAIMPDGSRFAAGFTERDNVGWARVWDGATGNALSPLIKTGDECRKVWFTAGGHALVTATANTARVWDARTGEALSPPLSSEAGDRFNRGPAVAIVSGDVLLVRRTKETSQFDRWLLAAEGRPVDALRRLAEALAGRRRDKAGNLQPIPASELLALRKRVAGLFPERFGDPVAAAEAVLTYRPDPRVKQLAVHLANQKADPTTRYAAAHMLGRLKAPASQPLLVAALRDPSPTVRQEAASSLGNFEPRSTATVQALVGTLKQDGDAATRANAARALHGSAAKAVKADLLRALKEDAAAGVRQAAAFSLRGAKADPDLLAALRSACAETQPPRLRVEAAMTVAVLVPVPDDMAAIGVLQAELEGKDRWAGHLAARYLYELGPRAAPAAAALARVVEKGTYRAYNNERTWYAVHALSRMGPAAKPAVPALLAKMGQDDANPHWYNQKTQYVPVRDNIFAYTLARVGPDVVPDLLKVFKEDRNAQRRRAAVLALGFLGPKAKAAVAALEAEAKKLAEKETKNRDEQWLATALGRALGRMRDPKALAVEKME
jgi:HEAT repeat protein